MKSILDYAYLDETEKKFFKALDSLPAEYVPLFEKMLYGTSEECDEAAQKLREYAEQRRASREQNQ